MAAWSTWGCSLNRIPTVGFQTMMGKLPSIGPPAATTVRQLLEIVCVVWHAGVSVLLSASFVPVSLPVYVILVEVFCVIYWHFFERLSWQNLFPLFWWSPYKWIMRCPMTSSAANGDDNGMLLQLLLQLAQCNGDCKLIHSGGVCSCFWPDDLFLPAFVWSTVFLQCVAVCEWRCACEHHTIPAYYRRVTWTGWMESSLSAVTR